MLSRQMASSREAVSALEAELLRMGFLSETLARGHQFS